MPKINYVSEDDFLDDEEMRFSNRDPFSRKVKKYVPKRPTNEEIDELIHSSNERD